MLLLYHMRAKKSSIYEKFPNGIRQITGQFMLPGNQNIVMQMSTEMTNIHTTIINNFHNDSFKRCCRIFDGWQMKTTCFEGKYG